jgi:preprotein translocase subunit SecF
VEILRDVRIDWLGKKFFFIAASAVLLAIGVAAYFVLGGLAFGIDFTGGTILYLKFNTSPDLETIRNSLKSESVSTALIQQYGDPADNSVQVRLQTVFEAEEGVDTGHGAVQSLLRESFDPEHLTSSLIDFNNTGFDAVSGHLKNSDPDKLSDQGKTVSESDEYYENLAREMLAYRDGAMDGLVNGLDDLKNVAGVTDSLVNGLGERFYAGPFAVKGVESVGAIVGSDLRRRASLAVGLSLLGMLVYIGFRFKPIYGVAALVALFHDVLITLGLFAVTQKEISLTVTAALLTLVGYSVNDSIVVFDRVRENLRLHRKESLPSILNLSINHTLARTVMTSGMTFLAVVSLYLFGGEVLNGFAFALTIGIIVGTYSSIAIAAPIVEWWSKATEQKPTHKAA